MSKIEFKDIINRESGKNAVVLGLGPSLKAHIEKVKQLGNDFVIIVCNDIDTYTDINRFDYWVWANSQYTIKHTHERLNSKNAFVVYADSVDLTPREKVDQLLTATYTSFDQRHFDGRKCAYGLCCDHIIPGRLTIQEEYKNYTNYHTYSTSSDTVAIHMLYLAVLLGCKNIYVTGLDLNYAKGYVNGGKVHQVYIDEFNLVQGRTLDTIKTINDSAKNINVNIYCLDQGLPISNILEYKELP